MARRGPSVLVAARAASSVMREGLGFGHGRFAGAFQDEVPGVGVGQGARPVEGRAEPAQQRGVAELDVADVSGGGADAGGLGGVGAGVPGGGQPARVEPFQEGGGAVRAGRRGR